MTNPNSEKQFEKDLRANEDASDKLDRELNAKNEPPIPAKVVPTSMPPPPTVPAPVVNTVVGSKPVTHVVKTRKQEILEEYGGVRTNVPINHPEFWNL